MPASVLPATPETIAEAGRLLRDGRLVAFPTETVYGLGCDATNPRAVAEVFRVKGRPRFNPLIVHVLDAAAAAAHVTMDERAQRLIARFWPGPLTLVLPRRPDTPVTLLASAGLETLAVRAPAHPVARAMLAAARCPVAAPSANPSQRLSPTRADHVAATLFFSIDMVIDGGPCAVGVESTVVDLTGPEPLLLRPGGLPAEVLEAEIGSLEAPGAGGAPRSPGMLARHYAPGRPLRLEAATPVAGEAWIGFGPGQAGAPFNLSPTGDLVEAAANLFALLHLADRDPWRGIAVAPIPDEGLGRAINDRLRRAATAADEDDWGDGRGPAGPCVLPGD